MRIATAKCIMQGALSVVDLAALMRITIETIPGTFGTADVARKMEAAGVSGTIHWTRIVTAIRKLADAGELEVVEAPRGRRPGVYRVKGDQTTASAAG